MAAKPVKQAAKAGNEKIADATRRAGSGKLDARERIACAQRKGQPTVPCNFGVARAGEGPVTVVVTRPDSRARVIFFERGKPIGADTSQAVGYGRFGARKESNLHFIQIGEERDEIPGAVVMVG